MFTLNFIARLIMGEPINFFTDAPWWLVSLEMSILGLGIFFLSSGLPFLYFWVWRRQRWSHRKIQQVAGKKKVYWREFYWSFWSTMVSAGIAVLWVYLYRLGWTQTYLNVSEWGWSYFWLSVLIMVITQDAYFYWTHRLFHIKKIYKIVHKAHHESTAPSPWNAFGFHPYETLIGGGHMLLVFLLLPHHPSAFFIFMIMLKLMNAYHHMGYEIAPGGASRHWLGRWINWATHHDMHHSTFNHNFGFYFNFWDKLCGTNHPKYHEYFEEVVTRKPVQSTP